MNRLKYIRYKKEVERRYLEYLRDLAYFTDWFWHTEEPMDYYNRLTEKELLEFKKEFKEEIK